MSTNNTGAKEGERFWFISTPPYRKNNILHSRMIGPFPTEEEARNGVALLDARFPGTASSVGQLTYSRDHDTEYLEMGFRQARGDLAEELAGPNPRAPRVIQ